MLHVEAKDLSVQKTMSYLLGGVSPRPIALASTISKDGIRNLSPFSFFNAFGGNPPTVAFSPSRRQRDATTKDTYRNLVDTGECVIQAVTYSMVQQVSLASTEYESDVDEFVKCGLTPVKSDLVKPDRVKESPFQMECKVKQIFPLGEGPGSGNLVVCEVLKFHIAEDIFKDGIIQPDLIDTVGRNSANFYTRARGDAIFKVEKPIGRMGVGYDNLPEFIRSSHVYSANNLGQFANSEKIPTKDEVVQFAESFGHSEASEEIFHQHSTHKNYQMMLNVALLLRKSQHPKADTFIEQAAKCALECNDTEFAWKAALCAELPSRRL
jgi:flavin reductase (DIM6/NTAB) family NADH-FMN oxidoreductase RutF